MPSSSAVPSAHPLGQARRQRDPCQRTGATIIQSPLLLCIPSATNRPEPSLYHVGRSETSHPPPQPSPTQYRALARLGGLPSPWRGEGVRFLAGLQGNTYEIGSTDRW